MAMTVGDNPHPPLQVADTDVKRSPCRRINVGIRVGSWTKKRGHVQCQSNTYDQYGRGARTVGCGRTTSLRSLAPSGVKGHSIGLVGPIKRVADRVRYESWTMH